ncbi:MAG: ATPase, T2SS/T4P/T4SS family [Nocardioidaceae bacterium]
MWRGTEVVDMLAAMNTGHEGSCGTIHANSARDVPARFEALGVAAGLPRAAIHAQLASALQVIIQLRRGRDGIRRVVEIAVLHRRDDGLVEALTAIHFAADGGATIGPGGPALESLLLADGS